jgi:hypothetical protein
LEEDSSAASTAQKDLGKPPAHGGLYHNSRTLTTQVLRKASPSSSANEPLAEDSRPAEGKVVLALSPSPLVSSDATLEERSRSVHRLGTGPLCPSHVASP